MPILIAVTVGLQLMCAVHVARTGRPTTWIFVVMMLPVAGSLAYLLLEILPEWRHSRAARQAATDIGDIVDPDREVRRLALEVDRAATVENRFALAKELLRRDRQEEARPLLEACLAGVHADDPGIMMALARARFGCGDHAGVVDTLDRLRAAHPDLSSADGHLLYARALEGLGRDGDALGEYAALTEYFPGEEARCRHALLLQRLGDVDAARGVFAQVVRSVDLGNKLYFRAQRDWYEVARRNLQE
ncbi:MAG: hypothetical protein HKM95_14765 [Inquilinus sp.]|nr:hypothetical protein [Inquilinus sp.]